LSTCILETVILVILKGYVLTPRAGVGGVVGETVSGWLVGQLRPAVLVAFIRINLPERRVGCN
jgi:hypothetical protein